MIERLRVGEKNEALFPGRVPHVRLSVHGSKKTGVAPSNATTTRVRLRPKARALAHEVKAFEKPIFGPCTLRRTWGTRPESKTVVEEQIRWRLPTELDKCASWRSR
jgi:hypothetical protein